MMRNNPLITVVVPVYNDASYLEESICSLLSQDMHRLNLSWLMMAAMTTAQRLHRTSLNRTIGYR